MVAAMPVLGGLEAGVTVTSKVVDPPWLMVSGLAAPEAWMSEAWKKMRTDPAWVPPAKSATRMNTGTPAVVKNWMVLWSPQKSSLQAMTNPPQESQASRTESAPTSPQVSTVTVSLTAGTNRIHMSWAVPVAPQVPAASLVAKDRSYVYVPVPYGVVASTQLSTN
jgi:hypothetical protein